MSSIDLVLILVACTAALEILARALRLPLPALLVAGGLVVALIPGVPRVKLDPEAIFVVFIPPLLYWTSLTSSFRDFRRHFASISLLAVGLVLATTAAVAAVAHALVPELTWASAFVLGAIVSPPDPVATIAVMRGMTIPRVIVTILEGEGLVNDATALVAYQMSVAAVVSGTFALADASLRFFVAGFGGVGVGLLMGVVIEHVRRHIGRAPTVEATISLLTPFVAFLPAEHFGMSGVLAVVAVGLYLGRKGPKIVSAQSRLQSMYMWRMIAFLLEGLIFLLVGLELPLAFENLGERSLMDLMRCAVLVSGSAIAVRMLWILPQTFVARILAKSRAPREPIPSWRNGLFIGWAGIRGGDSLVIALSLPLVTSGGGPFPGRPMIIFLTFFVILATLVFIGISLTPIARWLELHDEGEDQREELEARERLYAAAQDALERSETAAVTIVKTAPETVMAQRVELIRMRDEDVIADEVMHRIQHELDLEEVLLESRAHGAGHGGNGHR